MSYFQRRQLLVLSVAAAISVAASAAGRSDELAVAHPAEWPSVSSPMKADPKLDAAVKTLLDSMTIEEKVGQMIQADIKYVTPDDVRTYRLGSILAGGNSGPDGQQYGTAAQWQKLADAFYRASMDVSGGGKPIPVLFGIDAVHGHNNLVGSTLFPQNSALGNARDPALIRAIGAATAEELRASGISWTFAPTLTVPQDNRWGRSYEGYSENPKLVAQYAGAVVEGLEGKVGTTHFLDADHVIATAKHFLGDGGTRDGKDQGDAQVSEAVLRDVHAAGYPPAIRAGVQVVMVSFSSWNGVKMAGNKSLITGVLKQRFGFDGIVLGDWNAHGQVPGCTNEDCAAAYNAGIDMLEAPDSWKGLYIHTLAEAKSGVIPMSRIDDAVTRILRVKMRLGMFSAGAPSNNPLEKASASVIGSAAHRALARRAVRESLVLLKNQHHLLPLDPRKHILLAGDGADDISKQNGGWTLTWQGTGLKNADFPGATSIWAGIEAQVKAAGGSAELNVEGHYTHKPDVAIVVFGEDPYAEFQGDLPNLAYRPGDDHDLELIRSLRKRGIPVVAVFITGRPLWMNREINAADAFVVAWLPGSEGEGIADVLLRNASGAVAHDFHGKLAYSWPRTALQTPLNVGQPNYDPQFAYGYGLSYRDNGDLPRLAEVSGVSDKEAPAGLYFLHGKPVSGFVLRLAGSDGKSRDVVAAPAASADEGVQMTALDYRAQEDARKFEWHEAHATVSLHANATVDMDRQTNGDVLLVTTLRIDALPTPAAQLALDCGAGCRGKIAIGKQLQALPKHQWVRLGVPLKCFRAAGASMKNIDAPFEWSGGRGDVLAVAKVALGTSVDYTIDCPLQ